MNYEQNIKYQGKHLNNLEESIKFYYDLPNLTRPQKLQLTLKEYTIHHTYKLIKQKKINPEKNIIEQLVNTKEGINLILDIHKIHHKYIENIKVPEFIK
ncbi:hypothetical protein K9L67_04195 [Candidatus Woesearchaeota archaeon]|nr:hypothetical protein [Candidatus Woesearchaeota archaeon]MCF7901401.1 hypothetical protein [Candidatus Woesearchaeota archaeon]MCF8013725.1 hypothetical protein [Candidatus Woesearchaeota archaeon]